MTTIDRNDKQPIDVTWEYKSTVQSDLERTSHRTKANRTEFIKYKFCRQRAYATKNARSFFIRKFDLRLEEYL